jgi:hypothetical protein
MYDGKRGEIKSKCFFEDAYIGKILFFLHNLRFGEKPGGDSSLSLNDRFGKYVNDESKHKIENGSQIICLGLPLHYLLINCTHWHLETYFITGTKEELRNFVSYNIEGSMHLYIYTKCSSKPSIQGRVDPVKYSYVEACKIISG